MYFQRELDELELQLRQRQSHQQQVGQLVQRHDTIEIPPTPDTPQSPGPAPVIPPTNIVSTNIGNQTGSSTSSSQRAPSILPNVGKPPPISGNLYSRANADGTPKQIMSNMPPSILPKIVPGNSAPKRKQTAPEIVTNETPENIEYLSLSDEDVELDDPASQEMQRILRTELGNDFMN